MYSTYHTSNMKNSISYRLLDLVNGLTESLINEMKGRPIVYADEMYIYSSHTTSYAWDDRSGAGLKAPLSKGRHLIITHAINSTLNSLC